MPVAYILVVSPNDGAVSACPLALTPSGLRA